MRQLSFKRYRFPPDIIRHAIWLYARFTMSFRDVEDTGRIIVGIALYPRRIFGFLTVFRRRFHGAKYDP